MTLITSCKTVKTVSLILTNYTFQTERNVIISSVFFHLMYVYHQ